MEDIQRIFNYVTNAVSSLLTSGLQVTVVISARRHLTDDTFSGRRADLVHLCWEGEVQLPPGSAACLSVPVCQPELGQTRQAPSEQIQLTNLAEKVGKNNKEKKVVFCCVSGCYQLIES